MSRDGGGEGEGKGKGEELRRHGEGRGGEDYKSGNCPRGASLHIFHLVCLNLI